jgi:hypothetical protein
MEAPLRFERAVLDGPLPAPPPGCVRVLSQTLSADAQCVYDTRTRSWREQLAASRTRRPSGCVSSPAPPWAELLAPLPDDCLADEEVVLRSLRRQLQLPQARYAARSDALSILHERSPRPPVLRRPTPRPRRCRRMRPSIAAWRRFSSARMTTARRCAGRCAQ